MKYDDMLKTACTRLDEAITADKENRLAGLDDLKKLVGEQWPEEIRREREADGKPCLTINQLPQHVRQVTGDIRRMNPAINVTAGDDEASEENAELIEGLIRQIEYASDASSIYEQAAERAAASSIGWFRILNEWEDDDGFNQEIRVKGIRDGDSVYVDPTAEMPTREDANYLFITETMSEDDFREQYPDKVMADVEHDAATDKLEYWRENGDVVVAEYYWREPVKRTIGMMADGSVIKDPKAVHNVIRKRTVNTHKVMWAKISGADVLEGPQEVPCRTIPVIAVTGEEWAVGDRVYRSSVIRYAKDPQQMLNYWVSANAEITALQPKAPYLVTPKQIAGLESFWNQANQKNRPYLPYNPDEKASPPSRVPPPISSGAMGEQIMLAGEFIKSTTGIHDAGLGIDGNEKSGVAIRQRQMESDVSTSIYADNMAKAIAAAGRIMVDMIPKVYDTRRAIRILGKDETERRVVVNDRRISVDPNTGELVQESVNDLTIGKYSVRVGVGPNYATRRQETQEGMLEFIRVFPQAGQATADLVAKTMDWPDADQFAERLKKLLPPQLRDPGDMTPEEQQQQAMAMQAQQQAAKMAQAAQEIEMRKAMAEASEAESDAQKAQYEAINEQIQMAIQTGQMNDAIAQIVQMEVTRALQGLMAPTQAPMQRQPY